MLGTPTGIGEYVAGLIAHLPLAGIDPIPLQFKPLDPWRFDRRVAWDQVLLPVAAARSRADLLHCASGTMPAITAMPTVVTVHDVAWQRAQSHARGYARWYFGAFSLRRYARARRIIVDSEFSRSELLSMLDVPAERVGVVYPGVADDFCRIARTARSDVPTVLSVGTVERRKNLAVVIEALAELEGVRLVVMGPSTPYRAECEQLAQRLGIANRICFSGYVERSALLDAYASADVAVVPSRYEGFGYAAAQALCAGVPVLVARTSSLPEIVAGDATLLDPGESSAWRNAIAQILDDPGAARTRAERLRGAAIARFGWKASVARLAQNYQIALA